MRRKKGVFLAKTLCTVLFFSSVQQVIAQDNSPYSRYGLGDVAPSTNVVNRGMGGISAAYSDVLSINFNNPASYSRFQTYLEEKSKKAASGRVLLDVGINYESRTLVNPSQPQKFTAPDLYFSYLQLGVPLTKNWGLSFGLRPLSRIRYKIDRTGLVNDHATGSGIDSATTRFEGNGGSFLPNIGTGFAIKNFSIGASMGYLFGKKEYTTTLSFLADSTLFNNETYTTNSSFGGIFFNAGAQYRIESKNKKTRLNLGVAGNWEQRLNAERDVTYITYDLAASTNDTVSKQRGAKGKVTYPSSYTAGFMLEHQGTKGNSWGFGADVVTSQWSHYRFFGEADSVRDNWQVRVGGNFRPVATKNYFSNVIYRAGFFFGPDYIQIGNKLPVFGGSFGMALPIAPSRMNPGQFTIINLGLEYQRRGNNDNPLKENLFRLSIGLNFSDIWFSKRKYE